MNHKLLIVALLALFVSSCAPKQTVQQEEPPVAAQPPEELKLPIFLRSRTYQRRKSLKNLLKRSRKNNM